MDKLLLALSLLSLVATANALWPRYAPSKIAVASFALSFPVIETPILQILVQALLFIILATAGAGDTATTVVALVVFLISWFGLFVVSFRARLAVPAVVWALDQLRSSRPPINIAGKQKPLETGRPDAKPLPPADKAPGDTDALPAPSADGTSDPADHDPALSSATSGRDVAPPVQRRVLDHLNSSNLPWSNWWWPRLPVPVKPSPVVREPNIIFAQQDGIRLRLDIYRPEIRLNRAPVLMYVHGGAWILGSRKEQGLPLIHRMARHGWVVAAVDYRLSPQATFPDHLIDIKRAVWWIREHISEYGGDPDFVAVAGNSAGGHLAALLALTAHDERYQPGFEDVDTSVAACVPYYAIHDLTDRFGHWPHRGMRPLLQYKVMKADWDKDRERYEEASPISRIDRNAPPFLLVHGDHDTLAPVAESRRFHEAFLAACDAPIGFIEVPGAQHAFEIFPSAREQAVNAGVQRFLDAVHADWLHRQGRPVS